jgi:hypothetical protein
VPATKETHTLWNWCMIFWEKRKFKTNQAINTKDKLPFFSRKLRAMHIITTICQRTYVRVVSGDHLWIPAWSSYTKKVKEASGVEKSVNEQLYTEEAKKILADAKARILVWALMKRILCWWYEKPATIEYQKQFVTCYLSYEQRAHHWIQRPLLEALELEEKKLIPKNSGYQ